MKKLKCESCGSNLKISESDKNFATCEYCGANYKLNDDLSINIKLDDTVKQTILSNQESFKNIRKFALIVPIIAFIIIGFTFFKMLDFNNRFFGNILGTKTTQTTTKKVNMEATLFNQTMEHFSGKQSTQNVSILLDNVAISNKTNDKRKVHVVFKDIDTIEPNKIVALKKELKDKEYEIILSYDNDSYVNVLTIK